MNRHFGKLSQTNEEVIILGYQPKYNEVLVAVIAAIPYEESNALRSIVLSNTAQGKDYLMDAVSGSVLQGAHHSSGEDWQTYLIKQAIAGRNGMVRKVPFTEVVFADDTQKAYFAGYGPSIEPEVDKKRVHGNTSSDAYDHTAAQPNAPAPATAQVDNQLADSLKVLAETQAAILKQLQDMNKPVRKTTRRKTTKKKPAAKTVAKPDEPEILMENPLED